MLFNSTIFLFLFMPGVLAVYLASLAVVRALGAPRSGMVPLNALLLLSSLLFYTWTESYFVFVMLGSTVLDYVCGRLLAGRAHNGTRPARDRWILACSIGGNLAVLGLFKYMDFGIGGVSDALAGLGLRSAPIELGVRLALPLGISFYTFQSMSYTIDVFRGRVESTRSFIDFACYVTMFPQLIAGPIVRYADISRFLAKRDVDAALFASGVQRFVYGLGKKVLIADTLARSADVTFSSDAFGAGTLSMGAAWIGLVCYTLQIYFDFSGYSDMAIGLGRMLGFRFNENFLHPYASKSLREFWRRWHISLSAWFRDYLYIPLGGNRWSAARTFANLAIVFLLCGLWHGASWHFIVWGALHGVMLFGERTSFGRLLEGLWRPVRHAYLLGTVMLAWVFFRCTSVEHAWGYLGLLFGVGGKDTLGGPTWDTLVEADTSVALVAGALLSMPLARSLARLRVRTSRGRAGVRPVWALASVLTIGLVILACWMRLASTTHQPFIYFRF